MKTLRRETGDGRQKRCGWSQVLGLGSQACGFSLVEVVVSLAILGIGLVGAMRVFPVGLRASARSEMTSRAVLAAQRQLEYLKIQPWEKLVEGETTLAGFEFKITTHISQPTLEHLTDPTRLKRVEVTVRWTQEARPHHLAIVTYIRRGTP